MSILNKYICRRVIVYYVTFVVVLAAFFVFVDFMEHVERITKEHAPLVLLAKYYIYYLPRIFIEASWTGFLIALLLVLGVLVKNNELTAMLAGGINIRRIAIPLVILGMVLGAGVFCVQEFVAPRGMMLAQELKESDFAPESDGRRVFRIAGIGRRNMLFFFDVLDTSRGVLTGVQVHTKKGSMIVQRIDADTATWDESERRWTLHNGVIREFDDAGSVVSETLFSSMKAPFKEPPSMLELYASGVTRLNFIDMRQEIKDMRRSGYDARRLSVDYHKKFAIPVAHVIMVLLGLPFAFECRRAGLMTGFALALGAALLYFGTFQTALTLGRMGLFPALVSAWLANVLFLGVGTGLMLRTPT